MNNERFNSIFTEVYKRVATTGTYSMETANKIGYGKGIKAIDMPREMTAAVVKHGAGCCFHYSWRLIYELEQAGISACWAMVPEPSEDRKGDHKCVVVYQTPDGERHVADIIEDIKAGVKMTDYVGDSCRLVNSRGEIVDNSKIDLQEMARISNNSIVPGYLKIYPHPASDMSFINYYNNSEYEMIRAGK